jgi:hypothetical protein
MKPALQLVPITVAFLLSGSACTPSSNRGPTAGIPNDSANDPAEASADYGRAEFANGANDAPSTDAPPIMAHHAPTPPPARPIILPRPEGPYRVRVVGPSMRDLRAFYHDGRSYVLGSVGERYALVLSNPTPQRVEAVISIDGLDAIDGKPADYAQKRGYILPAYGSATIEGFRTSADQVATFRFSSVADSYAGRLGHARDVGVIGVAFFPEMAAPVAVAPRRLPPAPPNDWEAPRASSDIAPESPRGAPAPRKAEAAPSAASGMGSLGESAAGGATAGRSRVVEERRGLGTEFGEARESHVDETAFARANARSPSSVVVFRYNDRAGLIALGIRVDPQAVADTESYTRETADPFRANRFAAPPP